MIFQPDKEYAYDRKRSPPSHYGHQASKVVLCERSPKPAKRAILTASAVESALSVHNKAVEWVPITDMSISSRAESDLPDSPFTRPTRMTCWIGVS